MAITTIDNLTEKTTAVGTDDLLLIAEKNGNSYTTKSIKANAVGGGGGGAEDFVVEFTITTSGSDMSVTADHTAAEVYAAYQQGKNIKGVAEFVGEGLTGIFYFTYIITDDGQFAGVSFHTFGLEGGSIRIDGFGNSWDISTLS